MAKKKKKEPIKTERKAAALGGSAFVQTWQNYGGKKTPIKTERKAAAVVGINAAIYQCHLTFRATTGKWPLRHMEKCLKNKCS